MYKNILYECISETFCNPDFQIQNPKYQPLTLGACLGYFSLCCYIMPWKTNQERKGFILAPILRMYLLTALENLDAVGYIITLVIILGMFERRKIIFYLLKIAYNTYNTMSTNVNM